MKLFRTLLITCLGGLALLAQQPSATDESPSSDTQHNVNSRYTVESVQLARPLQKKLSRSLRRDVEALVGQRFDPQVVEKLASRMRREVHVVVQHRVEKGNTPEHVRVVYETRERRWDEDQTRVTRLSYHQKQGWTGAIQTDFDIAGNRFEAGMQSDADTLIERAAGFNLGVSRRFGDHVRIRFEFDSFHQQWNTATLNALECRPDVPGIYRERDRMEPTIVVYLAPGLSLTSGLSFQQFQTQFPAARYEAANAVTTTLRHRRRWQASDSSAGHEWDAGYSLRAATSLLGSDFAYVRQQFDVRYSMHHAGHAVTARGLGGVTGDESPLFDRFTLGDSRTLRGWNKFDIAPLGGTRVAYGSLQYTWRRVGAFYDTGAVWDRRTPARVHHSAGLLIAFDRDQEGPYLAVGFPVNGASAAPIFIIGMNF